MKKQLTIMTLSFGLLFVACNNSSSDKSTEVKESSEPKIADVYSSKKQEARDTSYYFVKRLLNSTPIEVEKILGKPDGRIKQSRDCDYLPTPCMEANYQKGKYEVLYSNNLLKWITVNDVTGKYFDESAVELLNFPKSIPSNRNTNFLWWESYPGLKNICVIPKDENKYSIKYFLIQVDENYNEKFEIVDEITMANAVVATEKQAKVNAVNSEKRKQMIVEQFSSWDGSHINLTEAIKKNMNDPSSYEHVSTKYFDMGDHLKVVTEFRGTNSFGAKVKNTVIAQVGLDGHIIEIETLN